MFLCTDNMIPREPLHSLRCKHARNTLYIPSALCVKLTVQFITFIYADPVSGNNTGEYCYIFFI